MKRDDKPRKRVALGDRMTRLAAMRHLKSRSQASHHEIARWMDEPESTVSLWLRTYKVDWRQVDKAELDRLTKRARQRRDAERSPQEADGFVVKNAHDVRDAVLSECQWLLWRDGKAHACPSVVAYVNAMSDAAPSWWFRHREKSLSWWLARIAEYTEAQQTRRAA